MIKDKKDIGIQVVEDSGNVAGRIEKNHILTPGEMGGRAHMFARIDIPATKSGFYNFIYKSFSDRI